MRKRTLSPEAIEAMSAGGRKGGRKTQANRTPEERREHARHARTSLRAHVKAVTASWDELTDEEIAELRVALGGAA